MMRSFLLNFILLIAFFNSNCQQSHFIKIKDNQFVKAGQPYSFIGTNAWYFMNIGSDGDGGDRARLIKELDELKELGVNNIRIMASSEGPADEPYRVHPALQSSPGQLDRDLLQGLDYVLEEMSKRDMNAVLCLNNFFMWSGGMAQYVSWAEGSEIPYPITGKYSWDEFQRYSSKFYANEKAKQLFNDFLKQIITRKNSINNRLYTEDPTIMAWQLGNEPRAFLNMIEYVKWADETAKYIHQLDSNHLVSLGGEGLLPEDDMITGFKTVSQSRYLDYLTMHLWIENWSWYRPQNPETYESAIVKANDYIEKHIQIADILNKPIVLEEFGISRDHGVFDPTGSTESRLEFYTLIFDHILNSVKNGHSLVGCNFWSWSGDVTPIKPGEFWEKGDPFTGDPPHEKQGWYSTYTSDTSMLKLIKQYSLKLKEKVNNK